MVIISESHFSIHTRPEYGYAAVVDTAVDTIPRGFGADSLQKMLLSRGLLNLPDEMIRHKPEACLRLVPET